VDEYRRLAAVPAKDRAAVVRAMTLNTEGVELLNQGRFQQAQKPLRQALALRVKVLREHYPLTAQSYNNVAACLDDLGKSSEALSLFRKALEMRVKVQGENHPDTAQT
jgi:Tfp pilus assembly protein PilF